MNINIIYAREPVMNGWRCEYQTQRMKDNSLTFWCIVTKESNNILEKHTLKLDPEKQYFAHIYERNGDIQYVYSIEIPKLDIPNNYVLSFPFEVLKDELLLTIDFYKPWLVSYVLRIEEDLTKRADRVVMADLTKRADLVVTAIEATKSLFCFTQIKQKDILNFEKMPSFTGNQSARNRCIIGLAWVISQHSDRISDDMSDKENMWNYFKPLFKFDVNNPICLMTDEEIESIITILEARDLFKKDIFRDSGVQWLIQFNRVANKKNYRSYKNDKKEERPSQTNYYYQ